LTLIELACYESAMSIRGLAFVLAAVALTAATAVVLGATQNCAELNRKVRAQSASIDVIAGKGVREGAAYAAASSDGAARIREAGLTRIEYRSQGSLLGVDYLSPDGLPWRRDIHMEGKVRAREYFTQGRVAQWEVLADDDSPICQERIGPLFPVPGGSRY
jgi:hypothetical protein